MKNINYDLIKLLHTTLDTIWRLEKYYINDSREAKCHSAENLEKMLKESKEHAKILKEEISMRAKAGVFD